MRPRSVEIFLRVISTAKANQSDEAIVMSDEIEERMTAMEARPLQASIAISSDSEDCYPILAVAVLCEEIDEPDEDLVPGPEVPPNATP